MFSHLPDSFLQMNTIFISILIEALPFVLIGVFIAGFIQMFISEQFIARVIPKNKFLAVIVGSLIGVFSLPVNVALFLSFVIYWQKGYRFMLVLPSCLPLLLSTQ